MFVGACGKSAQIPLYVWLPDAMEGPTPVSALIHAATMVTAGVYMVARSNALFVLAPTSHEDGCGRRRADRDLRRVHRLRAKRHQARAGLFHGVAARLHVPSVGVGAFAAGVFHVFTHAFFKALLFLGSGSVIHAMSGEQDMRKMGELARDSQDVPHHGHRDAGDRRHSAASPASSPRTKFCGRLGFGGRRLRVCSGWLACITALMTAFYMFRLIFLTFLGRPRMSHEAEHHIHESPISMTGPLVVLAIFSIFAGWLGWPHSLGGS